MGNGSELSGACEAADSLCCLDYLIRNVATEWSSTSPMQASFREARHLRVTRLVARQSVQCAGDLPIAPCAPFLATTNNRTALGLPHGGTAVDTALPHKHRTHLAPQETATHQSDPNHSTRFA